MEYNHSNRLGKLDHFRARHLTIMALLLAMRILLSFIPAFKVGNIIQMGFGFVGTAFAGAILGPLYGTVFAVLYDLLDILIIHPGPFFIGFTLSAALGGFLYAKCFWRQEATLLRIFVYVAIVTIFINIGLNSLWLTILYDKAWVALIMPRLVKNAVSLVLNTAILYVIFKQRSAQRFIRKYQF